MIGDGALVSFLVSPAIGRHVESRILAGLVGRAF
jgi:hypothetical protein